MAALEESLLCLLVNLMLCNLNAIWNKIRKFLQDGRWVGMLKSSSKASVLFKATTFITYFLFLVCSFFPLEQYQYLPNSNYLKCFWMFVDKNWFSTPCMPSSALENLPLGNFLLLTSSHLLNWDLNIDFASRTIFGSTWSNS